MKDLFDHRRILAYDRIETNLLQTKLEIPKKTFEVNSIFAKKKEKKIENLRNLFFSFFANKI